jgi:hypothetical protein
MIKVIPNEQFLDLALLYVDMSLELTEQVKAAPALFNITHELTNKDFIAMGLYESNKLTGFVIGYALSDKTFYFSGIYVKNKNKNVGKLIDKSIEMVKDLGYTRWEANCTNNNIKSILLKQDAQIMYTRVKKEY